MLLVLAACGHSPSAPGGRLLVTVQQDSDLPSAGKQIELVGTSLHQYTDANGHAEFSVKAGSYVVRAYDLGTPGPSHPYVEQTVKVEPALTSVARFFDCTLCR
jgi:hypothetical protein